MSKNLTRKGLAFGALVALTSTVFAGTPAMAAGELVVAPSAGTSYNALAGTVFNLKTTFAPGSTPSSYEQLKYVVTTDANSAVEYSLATSVVTAPATAVAVSTTAVTAATTGASAVTVNYIGLEAVTTSVTSTVSVTAFVDANNDNALTAGEWNTVKTVSFKKAADVVPVVTVSPAAAGDTSVKATVAWGDLNVEQISRSAVFGVATGSTNSSLAVDLKVGTGNYAQATYASSTGVFSSTVTALDAAAVVTAQAVYATNTNVVSPASDTRTTVALGAAATATASARSISDTVGLVANVLKGNDSTGSSATTMVTNTPAVVRTNGTFTAQVKAFDRATTPVAKSGVAVSAKLATSATLRPASTGVTEISISVNGTKYTTNDTLTAAAAALTTDASGLASVVITSTGLVNPNTVTVTFAAQNLSAAVVTTQTDAAYTVTDDKSAAIVATNKNVAVVYNFSVKDQFGVASARTNERLLVAATQTGATIANQFVAVSAGKASFTITPGTDITADITVVADLQTSAVNETTGVTTWTANGTDVADRIIKIRAAAYSITVDPAIALLNNAAFNATTNAAQGQTGTAVADLAAPSASNATWATVTFTGSNAGEAITVSGTGVILSIDGATPSANTAAGVAQATVVTVYVASNTQGAKTLTVSNGTVSKTVSLTFGQAKVDSGASIDLASPAYSLPGATLVITGFVKDAYGNGVQTSGTGSVAGSTTPSFSVAYAGPGFVVGGTLPTATDSTGKFSFTVIVGAADTGSAVVTVKYDADGSGTAKAEVVKTSTTVIGTAPAAAATAAIAGSTKRFYVSVDSNVSAKNVVVKVAGKTFKTLKGSTTKKTYVVAAPKGSHKVTVFVGGKLIATKTISVK